MARNDEKQHKVYHTCSTICSDANADDHKTRLQGGLCDKMRLLERYGMTRLREIERETERERERER